MKDTEEAIMRQANMNYAAQTIQNGGKPLETTDEEEING
jgi:hypothetical protein